MINDAIILAPADAVVYPVPVRKGAALNVSGLTFRNNAGYTLYSIAGNEVQQGVMNAGSIRLNGSVPAGTYILELRTNSSVVRKKVMIME